MTVPYPKRLIEVDLPIKRISAHARREKSIRHGHISTLHIWWARRPLAACRAVILASLWPDPVDENCPEQFRKEARDRMRRWAWDNAARASAESFDRLMQIQKNPGLLDDPRELRRCLLDFIADFADWDNSTDAAFVETSHALVQVAHEALGGVQGTRPMVVDSFAGGGAIPLEALRVGADAFASDLNPVAVLLNKVVLEYAPKYGQRLADEVRTWGGWVKEEAEKELSAFYPREPDGLAPIAYLWARTVRCEGPGCGAEVPLLRSLWLAKKGAGSTALRIVPDPKERRVLFEIVEGAKTCGDGTVRRGAATCCVCGYTTSVDRVRDQLRQRSGGAHDARMIAVRHDDVHTGRRAWRLAGTLDTKAAALAAEEIARRVRDHMGTLSLVPDEPFPQGESRAFTPGIYGVRVWADLFTPRQALALTSLVRLVREAAARSDPALTAAIRTCLALAVDRMADFNTSLCVLNSTGGRGTKATFARQALPIVWDFMETNPFNTEAANWETCYSVFVDVIEAETTIRHLGQIEQASATSHPLPDDVAHGVVTDPPYYDAVPYADLSDFFYVWLRRSLGDFSPSLVAAQLTPKAGECVVNPSALSGDGPVKDERHFVRTMRDAMTEARRVARPDGIGVVVFAHKSTTGWEAQLQAMIDAAWTVTASWPIDTERPGRLRAQNSAALASSIHLVCRPRENPDSSVGGDAVGNWRDVLAELPTRIHNWMPRLAEEGVVGADAIFACLGPALEIFSRHARVERASGEAVTLKEYLEHVWAAVAKEALSMIFAGAETSGLEEDARLTAMWLWTVSTGRGNGASAGTDDDDSGDDGGEGKASKKAKLSGFALEYDAARKIAQGLGAHLEDLTSLVEVKGETARLLPVAERTRALFGKSEADAPSGRRKKKAPQMKLGFAEELEEAETGGWGQKGAPKLGDTVLDRVHQSMILFAAGRGEALRRFLVDEAAGRDGRFWRLAQALAALYPTGTDERRWVEGVLGRKKGLGF